MVNTDGHFNAIFQTLTGVMRSFESGSIWNVTYTGVMDYDRVFTESDITTLNSRPRASFDLIGGRTSAVAGNFYVWGSNIGYHGCDGYWPPGPVCPASKSLSTQGFSIYPAPEGNSNGCYSRLGAVGRDINGAAVYDWSDGNTYNNEGIWRNVAPSFEVYDMDPCGGHAANGEYHHHFIAPCLAEKIGDDGSHHSPIYGFINDGYPLYGPYQASGVLAKSCWQKRNYAASSVVGCSDGLRSCILVDEYDYTKGTVAASSNGPPEHSTVTSISNNVINSDSGIYYEDYYYNASCYAQGGEYLNEFNGHIHDGYGFHYHLTVDVSGVPQFPYNIGPRYFGCISGKGCCPKEGPCVQASVCNSGAASSVAVKGCSGVFPLLENSQPTLSPTTRSSVPTAAPTASVVHSPTRSPTRSPSIAPTRLPSLAPSFRPSAFPTVSPSRRPSFAPSFYPTAAPTAAFTMSVQFNLSQSLGTNLTASSFLADSSAMKSLSSSLLSLLSDLNPTSLLIYDILDVYHRRMLKNSITSIDVKSGTFAGVSIEYSTSFSVDYNTEGSNSALVSSLQQNLTSVLSSVSSASNLIALLSQSNSSVLSSVTSVAPVVVTSTEVEILHTPNPTSSPVASHSSSMNIIMIIVIVAAVASIFALGLMIGMCMRGGSKTVEIAQASTDAEYVQGTPEVQYAKLDPEADVDYKASAPQSDYVKDPGNMNITVVQGQVVSI